ncbi:pyridoxamine 5'-phosphate oxidase family protein [Luteimonas sp. S4-F44]|nr:pyridoxamine 5'-phosphate oxidase family protein [Luteimonas sp. S4-F44]UNK42736.1 pyridoxamine 5'-phosphate oxidase family protein [Luteimonas sp. S4-F44]
MASPSKAEEDAKTIASLIDDIDITMFTTVARGGALVSRPLSTQKAQFDGERIWFFVAADSPKIDEIARNPNVNLAYASQRRNTYVSVSGRARVSDDRTKVVAFWNDALKAYFPGGIDDPNLALVEVEAHTAEYWDAPGTLIGKAIAFATARVTKRENTMGENRIVDLRGERKTSRPPPSRKARGKAPAASKTASTTRAAAGKSATSTRATTKAATKKAATKKAASKRAVTKAGAARTGAKKTAAAKTNGRTAAAKAPAKQAAGTSKRRTH